MAVIRVNKSKDYTVMSNHHFRDKRLSLKAKGLLSEMLSLPNDWDYTINGLAAINKENETAIKTALGELKESGYLKVTKLMPDKTKSGRIEYIYDIYEKPLSLESPAIEKQGIENLGLENQPQYNTKELNTDNKILKDKIKKKELQQEFNELWIEYPKKQGKENALKTYIKARMDGVDKNTVLDGIRAYKAFLTANRTDFKYIKQGSTWFNQHCWEDDYSMETNKRKLSSQEEDFIRELEEDVGRF